MTPSVRRLLLITHGEAAVTREVLPELASALAARGVELVLSEEEALKHPNLQPVSVDRPDEVDLILVLGGDGTMLRALHRVIGREVACVGVNYGTFGFLTTLRAGELISSLPTILEGGIEIVDLPTVAVETPEGRFVAINDVLVTADTLGRMAVLEWAVNGIDLGRRGCDGILVSTPAGSTGYSLSAGAGLELGRRRHGRHVRGATLARRASAGARARPRCSRRVAHPRRAEPDPRRRSSSGVACRRRGRDGTHVPRGGPAGSSAGSPLPLPLSR